VSALVVVLLAVIVHLLRDDLDQDPDELWASAPLAREQLEAKRAPAPAPESFRVRVHRASH
jgi:hypothetical protein